MESTVAACSLAVSTAFQFHVLSLAYIATARPETRTATISVEVPRWAREDCSSTPAVRNNGNVIQASAAISITAQPTTNAVMCHLAYCVPAGHSSLRGGLQPEAAICV